MLSIDNWQIVPKIELLHLLIFSIFFFLFFFFHKMTTLNEGNWFSGPVKDAITLVSEKNCVFLVYIYGTNNMALYTNYLLMPFNIR